jgi:hypothetical protein
MPLYSHRNSGDKKIDDDFVDSLRGLMSTFGVSAGALTDSEKLQQEIPEKYRYENMAAQHPQGLTPAQEMSLNYQKALAQERLAQKDGIVTFDEFGAPIAQDFIDAESVSLW